MSRADKSNLFLWLAAAGLAVAAVPAADLFHDIDVRVKWIVFFVAMLVATICFLRAVVLTWHDEQAAKAKERKRKMIGLVGMAICGIGFLVFSAIYFWPGNSTEALKVAKAADPPSLLTLFMHDFRKSITGTKTNSTTNIEVEENGTVRNVPIYVNLYYDISTGTKFISIYMLPSADFEDIVKFLPDAIPGFFEREEKREVDLKGQGDSDATHRKDLPFSGRVYLYYPAILDLEKKAQFTGIFRDKKMALQIRDPEYAVAVWQNIVAGKAQMPSPQYEIRNNAPQPIATN